MLLDDLPQDVFDKVLRSGLDVVDVVRVMAVSRQMRRQAGSERVWREIVWGHFGIRDASETWSDLADRDPMDCDDIEREAEELERAARWRNLYAHLREKFGAGEAHWVSARGLYTDGGCDENDGDNFAGNLFNPDRHDKFFCSATSGNINCVGVLTMEDATDAHDYAERLRVRRKYMIWRCNLTAKVQDRLHQLAHDPDVPNVDYPRIRRECYEEMRDDPFDFSNWPDQEVFHFYVHHLALALQQRNEMGKLMFHDEEAIIFDDDAESWTKHPTFARSAFEMREMAIAWQGEEGPPEAREEQPDTEMWARLEDAKERGWGLGANSEGGGWVPTDDTPLRLLNSGLAMEEFGLGGDGECMLHHTKELDAIVREHGYGKELQDSHEMHVVSQTLSLVHHALELGMYDVLDMHIHKERPSSNTRRAKRDIDNCFWYGQREKAASGVGHPRRDVVLSKFEISRSGQFTCPVGCGALFVSSGPPDVDQATREKYANHIFYESEGARRWRRYLESQPEGYMLDRTGPGGLQVRDEGWPEDDDGPLKPFLGTDMSLFPDAAAVGDWIRRGCERERASTVFDGVDSLQKVHDLIREGVLPPIAAIHTSAAGVVVEFETSRSNHRGGGEPEPRFQPVAWFRFKSRAETLQSQRNDPNADVLGFELVRKRCARVVNVKLIACEDLMAEWDDHHDAPNIDCRSFSFYGVPVELGEFLSPGECARGAPYDTSHLATEVFDIHANAAHHHCRLSHRASVG